MSNPTVQPVRPLGSSASSRVSAGSHVYSRDNVSRYSQRAKERSRGRRIRQVGIIALILLLVGAGSAIALGVAKQYVNDKIQNGAGTDYLKSLTGVLTDANAAKDPFNVLLLGTDGRPGEDTFRSDSIILAHVDPKKKTVALISIPRDSKVTYKGTTMKVTETHAYGGPEAVVTSVKDILGVEINYYAEISFEGMTNLVDAVGGIDIFVPEGDEVDDPEAGAVKIEAGQQHMDGAAALTFCRARHQFADGDYTRMRHQRMVLGALANKILNHMDVSKVPSLVDSLSSMLVTTMDVDDIMGVMSALKGMDTDNMWSANLPSYADATTTINGKSYVFLYEDQVKEMMKRVEAGEDPKGPQTMGESSGESTTIGQLTDISSKQWAAGETASGSSDSGSAESSSSSSSGSSSSSSSN